MITAATWLPCEFCGLFTLAGNDLCTCQPLRDPVICRRMERDVAARHRASVLLAASHAHREVKAA